jgi:hypothetical protein
MLWKLFTRKRKKARPLAGWIYLQAKTRAWGLRISGWLQRKSMTLSPARLRGYAVLFLLFFGSWNGWIIVEALQRPHPAIRAKQLHLSHSILPSVRPPVDPSSLAGIKRFRSWLDSLEADTTGRKIYDSILQHRAGLLDSLGQIEKTFSIKH